MPLSREWSTHLHSAASIQRVFLAAKCLYLAVSEALLSLPDLGSFGASPVSRSTWNIFRITVSRVLKRADHSLPEITEAVFYRSH